MTLPKTVLALALGLIVSTGCRPSEESAASKKIREKLGTMRQAGYPATLEELDRWIPTPPDSENIALRLTNAFAALVPLENTPNLPMRNSPLSPAARNSLQQIVAANSLVTRRLEGVHILKSSRYPVVRANDSPLLANIANASRTSQLLEMKSLLDADEKRIESAIASVETISAIDRSLEPEPQAQGMRPGMLRSISRAVERLINRNHLADSQLLRVQAISQTYNLRKSFEWEVVGQRCELKSYFDDPDRAVSILSHFSRSEAGDLLTTNEVTEITSRFIKQRDDDYLFFLEGVESLLATCKLPEAQLVKTARDIGLHVESEGKKSSNARHMLSSIAVPSCARACVDLAKGLAYQKVTECAIAIERYRLARNDQIPSSLQDLKPTFLNEVPLDPFDGHPIRLKIRSQGYLTYSVGPDGLDDGGDDTDPKAPKDIVFVVEH